MSASPVPQIQPDHDVFVHLVDGHAMPDIPSKMNVGETVRYSSPEGQLRITFDTDGTPFLDKSGTPVEVITTPEILTLQKAGTFFCKCFITLLSSGETIGWSPEEPQSGGDHHVGGGP